MFAFEESDILMLNTSNYNRSLILMLVYRTDLISVLFIFNIISTSLTLMLICRKDLISVHCSIHFRKAYAHNYT